MAQGYPQPHYPLMDLELQPAMETAESGQQQQPPFGFQNAPQHAQSQQHQQQPVLNSSMMFQQTAGQQRHPTYVPQAMMPGQQQTMPPASFVYEQLQPLQQQPGGSTTSSIMANTAQGHYLPQQQQQQDYYNITNNSHFPTYLHIPQCQFPSAEMNPNAFANIGAGIVANGPVHPQQQQQSTQVACQQNQQPVYQQNKPSATQIVHEAAVADFDNWDTLSISELVPNVPMFPTPSQDMPQHRRTAKRKKVGECSSSMSAQDQEQIRGHLPDGLDFNVVAHEMVVQIAKQHFAIQEARPDPKPSTTGKFVKECYGKVINGNVCIRSAAEAIFDAVHPDSWDALKAMIIEANNDGTTDREKPQPSECIWMRAKLRQGVPPEKNPMKKNDLQRTNMSGRIHGLAFENACLLFMLVRHETCLGVRFGTTREEDGAIWKNDDCHAPRLLLHNGVWVFCANPYHVDTPEIRKKKKTLEEQRAIEAANLPVVPVVPAVSTINAHRKQCLVNAGRNRWNWNESSRLVIISPDGLNVNTSEKWQNVFALNGFSISGEHYYGKDHLLGTILFYFEVTQTSACGLVGTGWYYIGLSSGCIPNDKLLGVASNSYCFAVKPASANDTDDPDIGPDFCAISGGRHNFDWPTGAIKPRWRGFGDVLGCGISLNLKHTLGIFFTLNGILMGSQAIPIRPSVDRLYPTVMISNVSLKANFGDNPSQPFHYDINKCLGFDFE